MIADNPYYADAMIALRKVFDVGGLKNLPHDVCIDEAKRRVVERGG